MPLSTKPPGPHTGYASTDCYAAPLNNCGGKPVTREHYISKELLLRFGNRFQIEGPLWAGTGRYFTEKSMRAWMLCERHNSALSPLDDMIADFHDVLRDAHAGRHVGTHDFDGEDLERWALKVMLGLGASGTVVADGTAERAEEIPELHLRILFGEEEMPEWCGFYYIGGPIPGYNADLFSVGFRSYGADHADAGKIFGITIRLLDFQFLTSITQRLLPGPQKLVYRPHGFILHDLERGRVRLRWRWTPSKEVLVIKMRPAESPPG